MIVGGFVQDTSIDSISSLYATLAKSNKTSLQAASITGGLPEINLQQLGTAASWSERLSRGLGRGRLG
jgi:hypothetical protein